MNGNLSHVVFYIFLAMITALFLYVMSPFFYPIFWAAVIAGTFSPLYAALNRKRNRPNLNASVSLAMIILLLILPMFILGTLVFKESSQIYARISAEGTEDIQERIGNVIETVRKNPLMRQFNINERNVTKKLSDLASTATKFIFDSLKNWTQNIILFLIMFAIMIYVLFYFIRDGGKFIRSCAVICPLGEAKTLMLYEKFVSTTRATLKNMLILGGLQGLLGGILFWITDIEAPLIWGLIMVLAALLPTGSAIIWGPAGIIMLITGHTWEGVLLLAGGTLIIGTVDNLLRPLLVGKEIQMHPVMIFLSTLGGLSIFGFAGFIIGPVIASLFTAFWDIFGEQKQ